MKRNISIHHTHTQFSPFHTQFSEPSVSMEHLCTETLGDILKRLEVRDLIRCKSVCKYWLSLISDPDFIKCHLNRRYLSGRNNAEVGHRRIAISTDLDYLMYHPYNSCYNFFDINYRYLVGSCNGLVCISPHFNEIVVINPLTREVKKIPNPQIPETNSLCWGFGYDSINDDYKIVLGLRKGENRTCFQMFSLRSNVWKVLEEVNYVFISAPGILYKGMLHWVAYDILSKEKDAIFSFHLTDQKFREIPHPEKYPLCFGKLRASMCLGIMEDCLCIFHHWSLPHSVWVMKDYNKQSWEIIEHACEIKHDIVHCIKLLADYIPNKSPLCYETLYCHTWEFLRAPLFVESLVSPHSPE
ncbi:hypothetical protein SSX86_000646 [Deinandra increscens subsp. villosa]|uniref:F-box domain-containing protein n=1 Tax=Deinandra increscens subsp. villosa TaxID=3103831 RepID=A0AAP0DUL7_9ASTR